MRLLALIGAGLLAAGTTVVAPADAQYRYGYHGGYRHGGYGHGHGYRHGYYRHGYRGGYYRHGFRHRGYRPYHHRYRY